MKVSLVGLLFALNIAICYAGPTKEETAKFIMAKTNIEWESNSCNGRKGQYTSVKFSDDYCTMTEATKRMSIEYDRSCTDQTVSHTNYTITNFKDLDPDLLKKDKSGSGGYVWLETTKQRRTIKGYTVYGKGHYDNKVGRSETEYSPYHQLYTFNSEVNLDKLYRAVRHLIELCGGKGELF